MLPDPIPVVVLGRLAVARSNQGKGLGRALFQDAARRIVSAADSIGIRGMLVNAISEEAKAFYLQLGLDVSPIEPMLLMTTVANLRAALESSSGSGRPTGPSVSSKVITCAATGPAR